MVAFDTKAWCDEKQFGLKTKILWMLAIGDGANIIKCNCFLDHLILSIIEIRFKFIILLIETILFNYFCWS